MLEWVEQFTRDATRLGPDDLNRLRAAGFTDQAILQIAIIAGWFNYANRIADALGVGKLSP
jgi:alkylhydroperoxidase family enzyme